MSQPGKKGGLSEIDGSQVWLCRAALAFTPHGGLGLAERLPLSWIGEIPARFGGSRSGASDKTCSHVQGTRRA